MKLKDKVCVITGAAGGIGKGIAEKFAQEGAITVIADNKTEQAQQTAKEIKDSYQVEAMSITMDVADEHSVNEGISKVVDTYKHIDVLISKRISLLNWQGCVCVHL